MTEAIGLDRRGELVGQRKEHRENQAPAGVDRGCPPLSEPHFLYVPVGNVSALPAFQGCLQETRPESEII